MRYYVNFIEMTVNGENRSQPKAFNTKDEAMASYHSTAGKDISAETVVGYIATVQSSDGVIIINDKWGTMEQPTTETE